MQEKIQEMAELINNKSTGWYILKSDFEQILGKESVQELLNEFEKQLNTLPKGKQPHYSLIFYLAILIVRSDDDDFQRLADMVSDKKSYRLMKKGLEIFLSAKSPQLKYEGTLLEHRYKNKYEFVNFFSGFVPDYEIDLRGYLLLLELIYYENKQSFWELMSCDRQNLVVLCILLNGHLMFENEELLPFLLSEDEVKANGALFCIMNQFSYLVRKYQHTQSEENAGLLQEEVSTIEAMFQKLPEERRVHFIVNYLIEENAYPNFFAEELKSVGSDAAVKEVKKQDLTNLLKLIRLEELIKILQTDDIEEVFAKHFMNWVQTDANPYIWDSAKQTVYDIYSLMKEHTTKEIKSNLAAYQANLFITSFDRQIRYSLYLKDQGKEQVIKDILT
ncbi:hypothetical protein EJF36_19140 [Bacillus sp. HMF5848]|uniref:hypothetical protein n=1 Tax=Bacillus sp. HMF5848 TaxID=2495421 RepID=UPI000F79A964|nr:hypothetical protein [Bacillus sp. HMF5848]RSK28820.1 hypothetical protein EJF36_19140 [Bacillus sp. HMF5848]